MVTGIKLISQQQVTINTMGLNGITASQIPTQDTPVKRSTASDTRRVSRKVTDSKPKMHTNWETAEFFMQQ